MAGAPPEEGCSGPREIVQIWTISGGGRQARTAARAAIATRPTRPGSGRACPVVSRTPGGQVFTRANQPPGRDGGDSPRFGKNLTVPTAHVHTGTSRVHRVGGDHVRSIQANTVPWTARIAPGANVLLRAPYGPAAGNPAAMRQPARLHRPRDNPPFQVAGYGLRDSALVSHVGDVPSPERNPPERKRCRSGGLRPIKEHF